MRDYAELVKALRFAFEEQDCGECALAGTDRCTVGQTCRFKDAADAIEELLEEKAKLENSGKLLVAAFDRLKEKVPKWISVEERLPEVDERVLACVGIPGELSVWDGVKWNGEEWEAEEEAAYDYWTTIDDPVTHWMPLPEPPKGVE